MLVKSSQEVQTVGQQGRSERGADAYIVWYVERPSEARTMLAGCFNLRHTIWPSCICTIRSD